MPLVSPNKKNDEDEPMLSPEEVFVQKTQQKATGFFQAIGMMAHRLRTFKTPKAVSQIGHDIWYGNMNKRSRPNSRPLQRYKWLWDIGKHDNRKFAKPYTWSWSLYPKKKKR